MLLFFALLAFPPTVATGEATCRASAGKSEEEYIVSPPQGNTEKRFLI